MQKKYTIGAAFVIGGFVLSGLATATLAQSTQGTAAVVSTVPASQPMVLEIGAKGHALLRGTVSAIGSGTITVKSWGGDWTVNVGSGATVMPHESAGNDLSDIKVGDFVGVQGTVNTGTSWTIDAVLVRDWTSRQAIHEDEKQNVAAVHSTEKTGRQNGIGKIFEGTASNVAAASFTLTTSGGTAYTVNVAPDTKLVDRAFRTVSALSLIQTNNHVRVFGTASSATITAQVVRDTSLPI